MSEKLKRLIYFVACPILFAILGEFALKTTVSSLPPLTTFSSLPIVLSEPMIYVGVLLISVSGILWVVGMSKFEISFIYPFLCVNYVAIMVGGKIFLGESLGVPRLISMCLIILGLVLISRSPYSESSVKSTD
tara:strand:+ start:234 stop:632 length:399 start_codon:yes stop_codon:yes gene_type:complete